MATMEEKFATMLRTVIEEGVRPIDVGGGLSLLLVDAEMMAQAVRLACAIARGEDEALLAEVRAAREAKEKAARPNMPGGKA